MQRWGRGNYDAQSLCHETIRQDSRLKTIELLGKVASNTPEIQVESEEQISGTSSLLPQVLSLLSSRSPEPGLQDHQ